MRMSNMRLNNSMNGPNSGRRFSGLPSQPGRGRGTQLSVRSSVSHVKAARKIHLSIIIIFGVLALTCIGGGIYAVSAKAVADSELSLLGARLKTQHVGAAFVG